MIPEGPLDRLLDVVAPNAILNAGGRGDEVRCYPGTREEVIGKIEKWMGSKGLRGSRVMWLSGPAGAGKSAICQSVAERFRHRGQHVANFFFFRGDGTRNHAEPLVATLVYQLRRFYPALNELLTDCLTELPLICNACIEDQFRYLISFPVQRIQQSSSIQQQVILILDGLDECDDKNKQEQILVALHAITDADNSPFLALVASRAEPHLVMAFNRIGYSGESIFLDEQYRPEDDIRRFVIAKFDEIKNNHHLAQTLSKNWPAKSDIEAITSKSSGQFIYAATVMRFIQYSPESPYLSLIAIHEMQPSVSHNPLAQLDAVYSYIFSKARDIRTIKLTIGANLISQMTETGPLIKLDNILQLAGYMKIAVQSLCADLVAIIKIDQTGWSMRIFFYHASLSDYLADKSRSGIYHVDTGEIAAELSSICLGIFQDSGSLNLTIELLTYVKEATEALSKSLLNASTRQFDKSFRGLAYWNMLICAIDQLYLKTNKTLFKSMLQSWVRFAYLHNVDMSEDLRLRKLSTSASAYYKRYRATERVKFALRLNK
ncbi:hypothetical protein D9619_011990 [Psilocybe cf. subviscida]|uniref:NACHT domain-containing protein n=1 Tax=Psilocybe cf. subviscida TaxID=2480587 RepID=A0A8H5B2C2_9AGAR|nr:hypothetical protein D9619_011990 [Psilocybe cf. subviscida]